jgi:hypothetical protein
MSGASLDLAHRLVTASGFQSSQNGKRRNVAARFPVCSTEARKASGELTGFSWWVADHDLMSVAGRAPEGLVGWGQGSFVNMTTCLALSLQQISISPTTLASSSFLPNLRLAGLLHIILLRLTSSLIVSKKKSVSACARYVQTTFVYSFSSAQPSWWWLSTCDSLCMHELTSVWVELMYC